MPAHLAFPLSYSYWARRAWETPLPASGRSLKRIFGAIADTSKELRAYIKDHPDFEDIGNRMLHEWEQGAGLSLKAE